MYRNSKDFAIKEIPINRNYTNIIRAIDGSRRMGKLKDVVLHDNTVELWVDPYDSTLDNSNLNPLDIMTELVSFVKCAMNRNVIAFISPDTVVVDNGKVRVMDFGTTLNTKKYKYAEPIPKSLVKWIPPEDNILNPYAWEIGMTIIGYDYSDKLLKDNPDERMDITKIPSREFQCKILQNTRRKIESEGIEYILGHVTSSIGEGFANYTIIMAIEIYTRYITHNGIPDNKLDIAHASLWIANMFFNDVIIEDGIDDNIIDVLRGIDYYVFNENLEPILDSENILSYPIKGYECRVTNWYKHHGILRIFK